MFAAFRSANKTLPLLAILATAAGLASPALAGRDSREFESRGREVRERDELAWRRHDRDDHRERVRVEYIPVRREVVRCEPVRCVPVRCEPERVVIVQRPSVCEPAPVCVTPRPVVCEPVREAVGVSIRIGLPGITIVAAGR